MKVQVYYQGKLIREVDNVREIIRTGDKFRLLQYGVRLGAAIYVPAEDGVTRLEVTSYPSDYPF